MGIPDIFGKEKKRLDKALERQREIDNGFKSGKAIGYMNAQKDIKEKLASCIRRLEEAETLTYDCGIANGYANVQGEMREKLASCQRELEDAQRDYTAKPPAEHDTKLREQEEHWSKTEYWYIAEIDRLKSDLKDKESTLRTTTEKSLQFDDQHEESLRKYRERHEEILSQNDQNHAQQINTENDRHEKEVQEKVQQHREHIARMQREIAKTQQDHEAEKKLLQTDLELIEGDHAAATKGQKQQHDQEISQMTTRHAQQVQRLNAAKTTTRKQMGQEISELKEKHTIELNALVQRHTQMVSQMKAAHATQVETMQTKHTTSQTHLKEQLQSYSGALLTRDIRDFTMLEMEDLKPLSDNEIKSKFELLKQEVDTLAQRDWKTNPKHWTNQVVSRLSSNQRVLRRQILQDSIWTLLHAFVFCSPFRVFGEEGETLEVQWNERCGKDGNYDNGTYTWPKPSMETERWRYATVAECRASLRKPLPSQWDPRVGLKKGFMSSMDNLKSEIAVVLGELIVLDKEAIHILEKMTKRAANLWLEFALQRYRILIVVSGSGLESAGDRVKKALEGSLELVVAPRLKRYGTSAGLDLNLEGSVGGLDGEIVKLGMS